MIKENIVLIVGAGASNEYGLPVGNTLKDEIAQLLNMRFEIRRLVGGDYTIFESFKHHRRRLGDLSDIRIPIYTQACQSIVNALHQAISIDHFVNNHNGNSEIELCSKLGIAKAILNAEKKSSLFVDKYKTNKMHFDKLDKGWLNNFFKVITENCTIDDLAERLSMIKMIIFNYDRCIEHYLFHSFQNYYNINADDSARLVSAINFFHPYGKVGNLPWEQSDHTVEFGAEPSPNELLDIALRLRTFTEGVNEAESEIKLIRDSVFQAKTIVFLGFHYHKLNLKLFGINDELIGPDGKKIFGTALNISNSDCDSIRSDLQRIFTNQISRLEIRSDLECNGLFNEYWRALSLSEL